MAHPVQLQGRIS